MSKNIWTENKGRPDDMLAASSLEQQEDVSEATVRHGKILLSNCTHCGRQVKSIAPWPEVAGWYLGQPQPNSKPTRQGIMVANTCACGRVSPMLVKWTEVQGFVEEGVQSGAIPPQIFQTNKGR